MTSENGHRIGRQELELAVDDIELAKGLMSRMSGLCSRRLAPMIDRVCTELSPGGCVDRLDVVEVDLGHVHLEDFDDAFLRELEAALRRTLAAALPDPTSLRDGARVHAGRLELLEVFARTGNLPWFADRRGPDPVASSLRELLRAAPDRLAALLREQASDDAALMRLVRHGEDDVLAALVERLAPSSRGELAQLVPRLAPGSPSTAGGSDARSARNRAWALALTAVARPEQRPLARVADEPGGGTGATRSLAGEQDIAPRRTPLSRTDDAPSEPPLPMQLPDSPLPAPFDSPHPVAAVLCRQPAAGPDPTRTFRPAADRSEPSQPAPSSPSAAAAAGSPQAAEHDGSYTDISRAPRSLARADASAVTLAEPRPDEPGDPSSRPEAPPERRGSPSPARARRLPPPERRPAPSARERAKTRRALAALGELHLDNAGLVLLWPFLERFFARLELLDERRFVDLGATTRAVLLLQALAEQQPEPLEYRLPLNKLLCGLAPADPLELDTPPTELHLAECEHLLAAVIDHATILRDMSLPTFRATFLQRPGMLTTRDGAWLLRVERQPHDVVLDRFPWTWTWVRLPWMPEPLRVEW